MIGRQFKRMFHCVATVDFLFISRYNLSDYKCIILKTKYRRGQSHIVYNLIICTNTYRNASYTCVLKGNGKS